MELEKQNEDLTTSDRGEARSKILAVEDYLMNLEGSLVGNNDRWPLKHSFSDGIYVREMFIPKGDIIVGKIHKHEHPNFLMKGTVNVFTEGGGQETIVAPCSMISAGGTKRTLYAETDLVWITVHNNPDNITDIPTLENLAVVDTYDQYDNFKALEEKKSKSLTTKLRKSLIKFLEV